MTDPSDAPATVTAGMVIIGNEILSGRTQDLNVAFVAKELNAIGIQMLEVRVVPDITHEIVAAVNALRTKFDYVFTTGGIGPTHDDITAEAVAAAFGKEATYHPKSYAILEATMIRRGIEFTDARKRMALTPEGAEAIENELGVAPGFRIENVFVLAGVPLVAQAMFRARPCCAAGGRSAPARSRPGLRRVPSPPGWRRSSMPTRRQMSAAIPSTTPPAATARRSWSAASTKAIF